MLSNMVECHYKIKDFEELCMHWQHWKHNKKTEDLLEDYDWHVGLKSKKHEYPYKVREPKKDIFLK